PTIIASTSKRSPPSASQKVRKIRLLLLSLPTNPKSVHTHRAAGRFLPCTFLRLYRCTFLRQVLRHRRRRIQHFSHLARQRSRRKRLLQKSQPRLQHSPARNHIVRVARHVQHAQMRVRVGQPPHQFASAHRRHHHVRQHERNLPSRRIRQLLRVRRLF